MAAKTSGEIEKEFIGDLKSTSGKDLDGWLDDIKSFSSQKRNDVINLLKSEHGFGHMNASLLAGIYFNGGKPVYGDTSELLDNQFAKAEEMRQLFEAFLDFTKKHFSDSSFLPKKTYVSILENREFAAINIKKQELRVGFDLGDRPFDETITKSKLTGPMPRISHQFVLTETSQLNGDLVQLLQDSYDRAH